MYCFITLEMQLRLIMDVAVVTSILNIKVNNRFKYIINMGNTVRNPLRGNVAMQEYMAS